MDTKLPPLVEENFSNLMDVTDKVLWNDVGLFEQVDSTVKSNASFITLSKLVQ
jgi:hypothetical protein